ncbi:MAG TPA: DEAD/DEAH box helicase family protein [Firmicutes bacterium]|nr:DEAD/DEAH box helicase family protein [Bacillota bacterium]
MNRAPLGNAYLHNSITGPGEPLLNQLLHSIAKADQIRFLVAFLLESGVRLIGPALKDAIRHGARIRILTGTYLSITEPSAIYYLLNLLGDAVEIRLFKDPDRSFHPKAYIFDYRHDPNASEVYVGSSNLSKSALVTGTEWNYRIMRKAAPEDYDRFSEEFERLWEHEAEELEDTALRTYAITWRQNDLARRESPAYSPPTGHKPEPRGAQIEALYYLRQAREEGINKGLVIAATGVGKTYLAAFDSRTYERVLFVAHREETLRQAEDAFRNVRPTASIGYYSGGVYNTDCDICLATVQTLSRPEHLSRFARNHFHYVIIDEFHHAAADSYRVLLDHFQPQFLLGLTATPYRADNRDIYELCDDNVIYEIHLKEAIARGLLWVED